MTQKLPYRRSAGVALINRDGDEAEIDIDRPAGGDHAAEFRAWRWERWEALPALIVPFKREVYEKVVALFAPIARTARPPPSLRGA